MSGEGFALALSSKDTGKIKGVAICLMLWHHLFPNALYSGGSSALSQKIMPKIGNLK